MHSITFVLLRQPIANVEETINAMLLPYRIDETQPDPSSRYDYWTIGDGNIADPEAAEAVGLAGDEEYGPNVCFVSRLGDRCMPADIITPDGVWHGLYDFGWKFRERETPAGLEAYARWCAHVAEVFAAHQDCVAVEIDTHS
jgi:hypothetical protein